MIENVCYFILMNIYHNVSCEFNILIVNINVSYNFHTYLTHMNFL